MQGYLSYALVFVAGLVLGVGLVLTFDSDSDSTPPASACSFPPFESDALESAPATTGGPSAQASSAQARTVVAESVVELNVRVCFEDGSTLETAGTGILTTDGPPWRVLTANHNVDARQWGSVRDVEIEVLRRGAFAGGAGQASLLRSDIDSDIAELAVELPKGMVWQAATPPREIGGPVGGTISFLCYFEREIRRGVLVQEVARAGGVPTYEIAVPAGPGCSGAGAVNQAGELVGIVIQANDDVTRVSRFDGFE